MSDPVKTVVSPLDVVYEKYKHLDQCLSDPEWCTSGEGAGVCPECQKREDEEGGA